MKTCAISSLSILLMLFLLVPFVAAHGKEKHQVDNEGADHMKAMYALKESIPEEYKIMERSPVIPDEESIQQGKDFFEKNCAVCHGESGEGNGPAAASMPTLPANLLDKKHSAIYGPGEKYWIIGNGTGKTGMPGFSQIGPLDRWHLINYILYLQKQVSTETKVHGDH